MLRFSHLFSNYIALFSRLLKKISMTADAPSYLFYFPYIYILLISLSVELFIEFLFSCR